MTLLVKIAQHRNPPVGGTDVFGSGLEGRIAKSVLMRVDNISVMMAPPSVMSACYQY